MACVVRAITSATAPSDCIDVSGDGSVGNPITAAPIISADVGNTVECRPDGLYAAGGGGGAWDCTFGRWAVNTQPFTADWWPIALGASPEGPCDSFGAFQLNTVSSYPTYSGEFECLEAGIYLIATNLIVSANISDIGLRYNVNDFYGSRIVGGNYSRPLQFDFADYYISAAYQAEFRIGDTFSPEIWDGSGAWGEGSTIEGEVTVTRVCDCVSSAG